jgi:hypothetical protein
MAVPGGKVHMTGPQSLTVDRFGAGRTAQPIDMFGELRRERRRHVLGQQNWHGHTIPESLKKPE